jgi:anti-sigma regulatory factor (Ser/Thr protein kinase)
MTSEHASRTGIRQVHPAFLSSQLMLAALPDAVPWARRHAADVLRVWGAKRELIETVELLVSELVTNAVSCSMLPRSYEESANAVVGSGICPVGLRVSYCPQCTIIEVFDTHPGSPKVTFPDADEEHGRGLFLVETLARQWNTYRVAGGKVVWCEVANE